MTLVLYFAVGIFIGAKLFPLKYLRLNSWLQIVCLCIVLFSLGASMGANPTFWEDIKVAGFESLFFAVGPILGSVGCVWLLSRWFLGGDKK